MALLALSPGAARADLVRGTVDLGLGGIDFSTQQQQGGYSTDTDVAWCVFRGRGHQIFVVDPPVGDWLCTENGSRILAIPDTTVESITYAPPDTSAYDYLAIPVLDQAYVMKTGDGFYVKFAVRGPEVIEYYVQMDGTNNLADVVPVEETTWGRVKALYR